MDSDLAPPIGDSAPGIATDMVEILQDPVHPYECGLDPNVFVLDRNSRSPIHDPGDYGFITQTMAEVGGTRGDPVEP